MAPASARPWRPCYSTAQLACTLAGTTTAAEWRSGGLGNVARHHGMASVTDGAFGDLSVDGLRRLQRGAGRPASPIPGAGGSDDVRAPGDAQSPDHDLPHRDSHDQAVALAFASLVDIRGDTEQEYRQRERCAKDHGGGAGREDGGGHCGGVGRSATLRLTLRKAVAADLGLSLSYLDGDRVLRVDGVQLGGTVDAWNRQCSSHLSSADRAVRAGDNIVSVNEIQHDPGRMAEECRDKLLLRLTIARGAPTSIATSIATTVDDDGGTTGMHGLETQMAPPPGLHRAHGVSAAAADAMRWSSNDAAESLGDLAGWRAAAALRIQREWLRRRPGHVDVLDDLPLPPTDVRFESLRESPIINFGGGRGAAVLLIQRAWRRLRERRSPVAALPRGAGGVALCPTRMPATKWGARKVPRCKYGVDCPFMKIGKCLFQHDVEANDSAEKELPQMLERRVIPEGSTGHSMEALYGRWAARTQCHSIVIEDPYLTFVRLGSTTQLAHATAEELPYIVFRLGMGAVTWAGLLEEFLLAVTKASSHLKDVEIISRGKLRHDCDGVEVVSGWAESVKSAGNVRASTSISRLEACMFAGSSCVASLLRSRCSTSGACPSIGILPTTTTSR